MDKNQGESEVSSQTAEQTKVSEEEEVCDAVTPCLVYAYSSLRRERELFQHLQTRETLGSFTVAIFISFSNSFSAHFHDSHHFFLLFSFILSNVGNEKVRMKEKNKKK